VVVDADIEKVLFDTTSIADANRRLGQAVVRDFRDKPLTLVIISNGALIFAADLVREISIPLQLDTISVSSYIGTESSGKLTIRSQLKLDLRDRSVLVVDDIFDTGFTLAGIVDELRAFGPAEVKTCVLLTKDRDRIGELTPDYSGFTIGDEFVVGYGLDYDEHYRHLPYIGVLRAEAANQHQAEPG
jgi:hypoxanthine phosphoribosyltransferase